MSSKTPYEIRLEILQMAKEQLDAQFHRNCDFATTMMQALINANKATVDEMSKLVPKMYGIDELTAKAVEMYAFILKKD
jgi:hypothetical protein